MFTLSVLSMVGSIATLALALSINENGFYDTRYNHLDVERILNNKRLVMYYGQCLLGKGPCTPQGTEFKRILPEALRTNCARCTEKQKVTAYLTIRRLKKEYPKIWQQLQAAWDPTGEVVSTFVNTVESAVSTETVPGASTTSPGANSSNNLPSVIISRFGSDSDNEINEEAPDTIPLSKNTPASSSSVKYSPILTTTTSTTTKTILSTTQISISSTKISSNITKTPTNTEKMSTSNMKTSTISAEFSPTTEMNYRTSFRPNRFNILLPRPHEIGRIAADVVGSIGEIGTKVIRTGARIADMVLTGVQATIGIGRPYQSI